MPSTSTASTTRLVLCATALCHQKDEIRKPDERFVFATFREQTAVYCGEECHVKAFLQMKYVKSFPWSSIQLTLCEQRLLDRFNFVSSQNNAFIFKFCQLCHLNVELLLE